MWIWLTLSLLLVIACVIFGIDSFRSSRTLQRSISREPAPGKNKMQSRITEDVFAGMPQQNFSSLKPKVTSTEENQASQIHQLNILQKRIEALEGTTLKADSAKWNDSGEDWEKLYYESKQQIESLENELDIMKEDFDETRLKLEDLEKQKNEWTEVKSELETRLNDAYLFQNTAEDLQRKLEGSLNREKELEEQLENHKHFHVDYEILKQENNRLRSETDELSARLDEINARNAIMEQKIKRLTELESSLEISDYEKREIKNSVEQIFMENVTLSKKLRQLQYKFSDERNIL